MLLLCTPKFTQTSIDVDKKCLYSFEYQPASTNCQTPSIRRVNAKNIAWRIAQKNAVQSLVPTCAFWLSAHMVANYMAWSLKIPDKLVDAYIHMRVAKNLRDALEVKFGVTDTGSELYAMEQRYVSNVSIIFYCSMHYIIYFRCFICINMLFYSVFGD